jgi:hypothetical protein
VLFGRGWEYFCIRQCQPPAVHDFLELLIVFDEVYLVDDKQYRHILPGHFAEEFGVLHRVFHHVRHIQQHVGIGEGALAEVEHAFLELVFGFEHAGGVAEHYLVFWRVHDAHYAVARGLCL